MHNPCEDFYRVVKENRLPDFDVLVTNPPYSSDHPARLIEFVKQCGKPWALLMPNWVYMKEYYDRAIQGAIYVAPRKRYYYWTPKALKRAKHTHSGPMGERTSPFISFWYIGPGGFQDAIVRQWGKVGGRRETSGASKETSEKHATLCLSTARLPPGAMDMNDPNRCRAKNTLKRERSGGGGGYHRAKKRG